MLISYNFRICKSVFINIDHLLSQRKKSPDRIKLAQCFYEYILDLGTIFLTTNY